MFRVSFFCDFLFFSMFPLFWYNSVLLNHDLPEFPTNGFLLSFNSISNKVSLEKRYTAISNWDLYLSAQSWFMKKKEANCKNLNK